MNEPAQQEQKNGVESADPAVSSAISAQSTELSDDQMKEVVGGNYINSSPDRG
jgi:hypothetical protein